MTDSGFVVMEKSQKGVLFRDTPYSKTEGKGKGILVFVEGGRKWFKSGDEKKQVKYEGDILNGVPNGQGTLTHPNGVKYVGEFKKGRKDGLGIITSPTGSSAIFQSGYKMSGVWKDDKAHGLMDITFGGPLRGLKFEGEFRNGVKHGQGTYIYPNGSKYVGEWNNGVGWNVKTVGTYFNHLGEKEEKEYKDGKLWNLKRYNKEGTLVVEYVNGKQTLNKLKEQ